MKKYIDCDRCGTPIEIQENDIVNLDIYVQYKNAVLCLPCNKKVQFDHNTPILYPLN